MNTVASLKSRRSPHESLATLVAREISLRIERGELKPGDKLPSERELMLTYGVSRTVVREATSSLRSAGRIATQQGRGAFVMAAVGPAALPFPIVAIEAPSSRSAQIQILDVRMGLETETAALAAMRRSDKALQAITQALQSLSIALDGGSNGVRRKDREFHLSIARATQNPYYVDLLSAVLLLPADKPPRTYVDAMSRKLHLQEVRAEHDQIVRAIERRDAEAARAAMRLHIANSQFRTEEVFDARKTGTPEDE